MKRFKFPFLRRFLQEEIGQSVAITIVTITGVMALTGAAVETGHIYYAYRTLVASTNAATLAAAQAMPNIGLTSDGASAKSAWGNLNTYGSATLNSVAGLNATQVLQKDSITATFTCGSAATSLNVVCQTPTSGSCTGSSTCNTIRVTQTATVNLWFGGLIGVRSMTMSAIATASMRGGTDIPYNIAIIIDTTNSMTATAPTADGCGSHASQIECATSGLALMLKSMDPCALNTACTAGTGFVDDVALFVFPALSTSYSANNYNSDYCYSGSQTSDTSVPYNFQNVTAGSQNLAMATSGTNAGAYEIIPFNNSYRANDSAATGLTTTAALVEATGSSGGSSCAGLGAPGGEGTYYAQVIKAAQAALATQQTSYPTSKNIMIILSDGNADACNTSANTGAGGCNSKNQIVADAGTLNGTGTNTSYTYPSELGQCGQAVQAAQAATAAGTIVYTVAMGSPTSGGCASDAQYTLTGQNNGAVSWPSGTYSRQPCNAIGAMASNTNTFFSDDVTASGSSSGCSASGGNVNYTTIAQIFAAIGNGLTAPRLIPNS